MRHLLLVLALTALLVASAFASGSAFAQGGAGEPCQGLTNAIEAQATETLPIEGEPATPFPGEGNESSALDPGVFHCVPVPS